MGLLITILLLTFAGFGLMNESRPLHFGYAVIAVIACALLLFASNAAPELLFLACLNE